MVTIGQYTVSADRETGEWLDEPTYIKEWGLRNNGEQPKCSAFLGDMEVSLYGDFSPAEKMYFNAAEGIGSPGYDASLDLTKVVIATDMGGNDILEFLTEPVKAKLANDGLMQILGA